MPNITTSPASLPSPGSSLVTWTGAITFFPVFWFSPCPPHALTVVPHCSLRRAPVNTCIRACPPSAQSPPWLPPHSEEQPKSRGLTSACPLCPFVPSFPSSRPSVLHYTPAPLAWLFLKAVPTSGPLHIQDMPLPDIIMAPSSPPSCSSVTYSIFPRTLYLKSSLTLFPIPSPA